MCRGAALRPLPPPASRLPPPASGLLSGRVVANQPLRPEALELDDNLVHVALGLSELEDLALFLEDGMVDRLADGVLLLAAVLAGVGGLGLRGAVAVRRGPG